MATKKTLGDSPPLLKVARRTNRGAFKLKEACQYLGGLSAVSIRRKIKTGDLKRHPGFRHIVIAKAECDRWLSIGVK